MIVTKLLIYKTKESSVNKVIEEKFKKTYLFQYLYPVRLIKECR